MIELTAPQPWGLSMILTIKSWMGYFWPGIPDYTHWKRQGGLFTEKDEQMFSKQGA